jgi:8-oxo-dGTP pyrophosphatase MutT (NUDIX family)
MSTPDQINSDSVRRWFPHVTVASIAVKDDKYLIVRENYRGSTVLNQPAGHVEEGETLEQAVIRETLEETGWDFKPSYLTGIYHFVAANGETYIRFTWFGSLIGERPEYELDPAIEGIQWMSKKDLLNGELTLRNAVVITCISDFEAGNRLPANSVQQLT